MKIKEDGFIKRNKKIILISLALFIISAIVSAIFGYIRAGSKVGIITEMLRNTTSTNNTHIMGGVADTLYLFIHNLTADILTIVFGLLFSVFSVILILINAVSIGTMFGTDFTFAMVSALPHAIFEYTASILALVAAFLVTKVEIQVIRNRNLRDTLKEEKTRLKDILFLFILIVVLLLIAAIIEANITLTITSWYFGF